MRTSPCIRPGCQKVAHARLLCRRHYDQAVKAGGLPAPVIASIDMTDEQRFFANVEKSDSGCWNWTGLLIARTGYGRFRPRDKSASNAHRWSYQHHVGPIPSGMVIDHLCRNRACVNPKHLEVVTQQVNVVRGASAEANRARFAAMTHCPHGHEKNEENTRRYYSVKRGRWDSECRPCREEQARRRYGSKRDKGAS